MAKHKELKVTIQHSRGRCYCPEMLERETRRIVGAMMSTRLANTIRVTVKVRDRANRDLAGAHGCAVIANLASQKTKSKQYTIYLTKDRTQRSLLDTLAHELCHVHQMAQGRVRTTRKGGAQFYAWRGADGARLYPMDSDYYTRPWEVEARAAGREHGACRAHA